MKSHTMPSIGCEGDTNLATIVVGKTNSRSKLRISVLLNTMPEYQVKYLDAEARTVDIAEIIKESDIIIGTGNIACEGILLRKPVIVVGEYGLGGLITPVNLHTQYNNNFKGRINGMKDEYFSLEILEGEIKRSTNLTFQELQMMSNQMVTFLHNIDF